MSGSKRVLMVALFGCLLLGAVLALPHRGEDRETYRGVIGVRHSAGIEAPRAPQTMTSQTMIASYLDYSLAGAITASGEPFDPEGYTAAHGTLPLGTRLLVSYGGRSVRVTVNDRGPHTTGLDLDLSLAAAREIGLTDPADRTCLRSKGDFGMLLPSKPSTVSLYEWYVLALQFL